MKAIQRPVPYRVGNAKLHIKTRTIAYIGLFTISIIILLVCILPKQTVYRYRKCIDDVDYYYNDKETKYPFTDPLKTPLGMQYKIVLITDLDTSSKSSTEKDTYFSYLLYGNLTISDNRKHNIVSFNKSPVTLKSKLAFGGRGMELSELQVFDGKLFSIDDRTGVIYEIVEDKVIPWIILMDGNGKESKGM